MAQDTEKELQTLDRDVLMSRMAAELPDIRKTLRVSADCVADKLEMDHGRYLQIEEKKQELNWSEYMSLLFLFWNNETGRAIIESKGLFPNVLKRAMSVNRNTHTPVMESSRFEL